VSGGAAASWNGKDPSDYITNVSAYMGLKYSHQHVLCLGLTHCPSVHFCLTSECNSKTGETLRKKYDCYKMQNELLNYIWKFVM
jgi:hypothetical protein